jgi:REP element-mobilizing transposase RayT
MPRRGIAFLAGEYYHLYNRGVDRQAVFFTEENFKHGVRLLADKAARHDVCVIAYCLMPNHYHLLVSPRQDHTVSAFVNGLFGAYVQAVNAQRDRVGPLFQGPFRAVRVDRDAYLAHLARYIHLNPVAAGLVVRPQHWPYSNYNQLGADGVLIGGIFANATAYRRFVEEPNFSELPGSLKLPGS